VGFFKDAIGVFMAESDLEVAEQSMGGTLKLVDVMVSKDPEGEAVLVFAAQAWGGYTLAFVEDKADEYKHKNEKLAEYHRKRAKKLYLRGMDYAHRAIKSKEGSDPFAKDLGGFQAWLNGLDEEWVPYVFWYAMNFASAVNVDREDMDMFSKVAYAVACLEFVKKVQPAYFEAGPDLALGAYYGGLPSMYGDNKQRALDHFAAVQKHSKNRHLLAKVLQAQNLAVQYEDKEMFDRLLKEVIDAPENIWPEQGLMNSLAKKKAARMIAHRKDYF